MSFYGRQAEIDETIRWIENEAAESHGRAALLVGSAGIGKSALLRRLESICREHCRPRWYVQREVLNRNEEPAPYFERVLHEAHQRFLRKPLRSGPDDRRQLKALLDGIPGMGSLLSALVADVKRPSWQRFLDYSGAISEALEKDDGRYILLIDPDWAMGDAQADEWLSVAAALPPRERLLIAQRPDDAVAAHTESGRRFARNSQHPRPGCTDALHGPGDQREAPPAGRHGQHVRQFRHDLQVAR